MTINYNEKLAQETEVIRDKVRRGMLPLVARNPALDKITRDYTLAQAERYHNERAKAVAGNKSPDTVPIPYRDSDALDRCADLILHEELTWSHPDKMSIVEYPVMSNTQEDDRGKRFLPISELTYGDMRFKGRRKVAVENKCGSTSVRSRRVFDVKDDGFDEVVTGMDVRHALFNACLTVRQREIIDLIFFDKLTQEEAAKELSISQQAIAKSIASSIKKLRDFMTKV